jgi:anaerobic selenocysteine-containing dehydrogenase
VVALPDEIEAGAIRALVVTGGNPLAAAPDPDRMFAALRSLEVLAVLDVVESPVTALATHVLPATGQLERADVTLLSHLMVRSSVQATEAVVAPGADRRPAWWVFARLGALMGVDPMPGVDADSLDDRAYLEGVLAGSPLDAEAVFAAGPHGVEIPIRTGWMLDRLPDRRWRLAPEVLVERMAGWRPPAPEELVLVPRRDGTWNNSVRYGRTDDPAVVRVHPDDAARSGVAEGDEVELRSVHGTVRATAGLDDTLMPGVVSVGHGRPDRSPGRLTSLVLDVDPLTTMPMTSGVPVRLRPQPEPR